MDQPRFIDTHCHLTFPQFQATLPAVLEHADRAGVQRMITIGTDLDDSRRCVALIGECTNVSCAVGVHPHEAASSTPQQLEQLEELARQPRVVAIGETGLDYHYKFSPPRTQQAAFREQLGLAERIGLPVVVHCRDAFADTLALLEEFPAVRRVVFHCFTGDLAQAREVIARGWMLSLTGIVTFPNAHELRAVARLTPAEQLMLETDSPYLSPEPVRNVRPNEPAHVVHIARCVAEVRDEALCDLARITTANAVAFFRLDSAARPR
jgi:TatD DNase family protein